MTFGKMPIANGFIEKKNFKEEFFFEMEVGFSESLSLFQLNDHPKPEKMFNENYPFFSGSSKYMIDHFKKYADNLKSICPGNNLRIIEIGSNDGTMLKNFPKENYKSIGFEPSKNVSDKAKAEGINSINNFFNQSNISQITEYHSKTDIIYASNCICHIPDLNDLIKSIEILLSKNGIFVFEEPYLGSMFEKVSYDQIYDEHIYMFSINAVKKIFDLYDLEIIDAQPQVTHGGSMRYFIKRKKQSTKIKVKGSRSKQEALQIAINKERKALKVHENRLELNDVLLAIEGFSGDEKDLLAVALSNHLPKNTITSSDSPLRSYKKVRENPEKTITGNRFKRSEGIIFRFLYEVHKLLTLVFTGKLIKFGNFTCLPKKHVEQLIQKPFLWNSYSSSVIASIKDRESISSVRGLRYILPSKMNFIALVFHSLAIISVFRNIVIFRSIIFF